MTVPVVTESFPYLAGRKVKGTVELVASLEGDAVGYATASGVSITGSYPVKLDAAGALVIDDGSAAGLPLRLNPNAPALGGGSVDVIDYPTGTVWRLELEPPGSRAIVRYLSVPDGAGPYRVDQILTYLPVALPIPYPRAIVTATADEVALYGKVYGDTDPRWSITGGGTATLRRLIIPGASYNVVDLTRSPTDSVVFRFRDPGIVTPGLITSRFQFDDINGAPVWWLPNDGGPQNTDSIGVLRRGSNLYDTATGTILLEPAFRPRLGAQYLNQGRKRAAAVVFGFHGPGTMVIIDHGEAVTVDLGKELFLRDNDAGEIEASGTVKVPALKVGTGRVSAGSNTGAHARRDLTGGDVACTSTTWAPITGAGTGLDLTLGDSSTLPLAAGMVVEVGLLGFSGSATPGLYFDVATIDNAGNPVNYVSGLANATNASAGVQGWRCGGSTNTNLSGSITYVLQAGDIVNSTVKLRPYWVLNSAGSRSVLSNANAPLTAWARVHG